MAIIGHIVLGVIIWQSLCYIVYLTTHKNEYTTVNFSFGIWLFIVAAITKIRLAFFHKYNCYQVFGVGDKYSAWLGNVYMTPDTAKKFRTTDEYGYNYSIKLAAEGKDLRFYPSKHNIVKEGEIFPCVSSKSLFKNFLKTP